MNRIAILGVLAGIIGFAGPGATSAPAADETAGAAKLNEGDYVGIIGDSITEQKQYSVFIEDYLLMCKPAPKLTITQFGWSGETTWGFAGRMQNDMVPFGANVVTLNFGMNDGGYSPETPEKAKHYHDSYTSIVEQLKKSGARFIVVGSPGCVDSDAFKKSTEQAEMYNKTLAAERDIARQVAQEQGVAFANVYDPMIDVMAKAKEKFGHQYDVAGGDGVHPGANGHLVMAYAYLKALACDGNIGTITVDLAGNTASATDGHKVRSARDGEVEIESSRYPFCFTGDPSSTNATTGIIEFLPFNQDLNRLMLVVAGASAEKKYKVTWGKTSKEFTGEALGKGINLAAEFLDNPFSGAFKSVDAKIRAQQSFETPLVKKKIHDLLNQKPQSREEKEKLARDRADLVASDKPRREEAEQAVTPVKHTIKVEEVK